MSERSHFTERFLEKTKSRINSIFEDVILPSARRADERIAEARVRRQSGGSDPIFRTLGVDSLDQIAHYLQWDPVVSTSPARLLSGCTPSQRKCWLDEHRDELASHISWVGTPIFSYATGDAKSYHQIVSDIAEQIGVPPSPSSSISGIETALLQKLWKDTLTHLGPAEREVLLAKVEATAAQYSTSGKKEVLGFAGLAAAQMSGFGVYVLGSTLLGALNSALGLGLGFGAFTGLSSAISLVIGPVGWAALGLYTIKKLGAPNYKKLLPVVILIASQRGEATAISHEPLMLNAVSTVESPLAKPLLLPAPAPMAEAAPVDQLDLTEKPEQPPPDFLTSQISPSGQRPLDFPTKKFSPPVKASPARRVFSRLERTTFLLSPQNRTLCQLTEKFFPDIHFYDLSGTEQGTIRDLKEYHEQKEAEEGQVLQLCAAAERKEARKQRKREEAEARRAKKHEAKSEAAIAKHLHDYSHLLPSLDFHRDAIERMRQLEETSAITQVQSKLGLMNAGQVLFRDSIARTDPLIYEVKAGHDYRIYCYKRGQKICIRLIGDKGTQEADLEKLRRNGC